MADLTRERLIQVAIEALPDMTGDWEQSGQELAAPARFTASANVWLTWQHLSEGTAP